MVERSSHTIMIAGASGFVGQAIIARLRSAHALIGTSRSRRPDSGNVCWRQADLFSLLDTERAMSGCDTGIYLVHSMLPGARLNQAGFEDLDLIIADNFARAAAKSGMKRIIYVGGLLPGPGVPLSPHLASRSEVETALAAYGVPVITLRAGILVGAGGSSYQMMERLVRRLPIMIAPAWTLTKGQPVWIGDMVDVIERVVEDESLPAGVYEIGGPEVLSYVELLRQTAKVIGKKSLIIVTPMFSLRLSRWWLCLITESWHELVAPLLESLRHEMIVHDAALQRRYGLKPLTFRESVERVQGEGGIPAGRGIARHLLRILFESQQRDTGTPIVCSVQRMRNPPGWTATAVMNAYFQWLPRFFSPFVEVRVEGDVASFILRVFWREILLLRLTRSAERSTSDRELCYITGGLLFKKPESSTARRARMEFRTVRNGDSVMCAIHDFRPALPWWIYRYTQAVIHLLTMRRFGAYLGRQ